MLDMTTKFHFAIHLGTAEPIEPKNSVLNQNGRLSVSFQSWFLDSFFFGGSPYGRHVSQISGC